MTQIAADRPGLGAHGDRLQSHAGKNPQIGDEHFIIGQPRGRLVDIEGVRIFHQEFAAAHDAESRPLLVAEFPLNVVEDFGQLPVASHIGAKDPGDHVLICRPIEQLAFVTVLDSQHFRPIGLIAASFPP